MLNDPSVLPFVRFYTGIDEYHEDNISRYRGSAAYYTQVTEETRTPAELAGEIKRYIDGNYRESISLDSLAELLSSKQVALKDLTAVDAKDPPPTERMVGYMDNEYYYLLPNVAFGAVSKLCREQGQEFPVSLKALYKHLRTDGILTGIQKEGNPTRFKLINKKSVRLLWIPADALNGPKPEVKQMDMTEVGNGEIPEEWK